MEDLLNQLFMKYLAASVIVTIIAVVLLVVLVWKISQIWYRMKHLPCNENAEILKKLTEKSFDKSELPCKENTEILKKLTEKSFDKSELPCKEHADMVNQHDKDVFELKTTLSYMNKTIENMNTTLKALVKPGTIPMTQQNSPLKITEEGWRVAEELGMKEMFARKWNDINELISEHAKSKNPYDVNDFCIQWAVVYPEKFLDEKDLDKVKVYAYQKGIDLSEYMKIIAVMARDRYFEQNNIIVDSDIKK